MQHLQRSGRDGEACAGAHGELRSDERVVRMAHWRKRRAVECRSTQVQALGQVDVHPVEIRRHALCQCLLEGVRVKIGCTIAHVVHTTLGERFGARLSAGIAVEARSLRCLSCRR